MKSVIKSTKGMAAVLCLLSLAACGGGSDTGTSAAATVTASCTFTASKICESASGTAANLTAHNYTSSSCTSVGGTFGTGCSTVGSVGHCNYTDATIQGLSLSVYFYDSALASIYQAFCTDSTANGGMGGTWVP